MLGTGQFIGSRCCVLKEPIQVGKTTCVIIGNGIGDSLLLDVPGLHYFVLLCVILSLQNLV